MQRELTAQLASASGMEVMSFRHFDCLLFSRGEILKTFMPKSHRMLFGGPQNRMVSGEIFLVFEADLINLRPPSKRFDYSSALFAAPIANFPGLTFHAAIVDGVVDDLFFEGVGKLLAALPDHRDGWLDRFGQSFFSLSPMNQFSEVVQYLRDAVRFETPSWSGPPITVTIQG